MKSSYIGKLVDNYRILDVLGRGGMGLVFKALHVRLEKMVALKMISPALAMQENFLKRFQSEARTLARLQNPHIVQVYDLREENDQWFIVMEYVEGTSLTDKIKKEGPLPVEEALDIFDQMLNAIGHAHGVGIIHRDIKPANVLLSKEGLVKVTDFGLAKDHHNTSHTQTMASGGTLLYMSPEQVRGLGFTDLRSDVYALGITLYEMLAGKVPLNMDTADFDLREEIIKNDFPPPSESNTLVPDNLDIIVAKAMAKRPDNRFQSVAELQKAVNLFRQKQTLVDIPHITPDNQVELPEIKESGELPKKEQEPVDRVKESQAEFEGDEISPDTPLKRSWKTMAVVFTVLVALAIVMVFLMPRSANKEKRETPAVASVTLESEPAGALVRINGDEIGKTPISNHAVAAGGVNLSFIKEGFQPFDTTATFRNSSYRIFVQLNKTQETKSDIGYPEKKDEEVSATKLSEKNERLSTRTNQDGNKHSVTNSREKAAPETRYGTLTIHSQPVEVEVWLDERHLKKRNRSIRIDSIQPGEYTLRMEADGYMPYTNKVRFGAGEQARIEGRLEPKRANLSVLVKPWGSIYIDGELHKKDTNVKYNVSLPLGEHTIEAVHPTLGRRQKAIQLENPEAETVVIDFNRKIPVSITAFDQSGKPVWARIVINGRPTTEKTPRRVELKPGTHTISVQMDGYRLVNGPKTITVKQNGLEPQKFILQKIR